MIDAGGGTIDLSTYCFTKMSPLVLEETAPAACEYHHYHSSIRNIHSVISRSIARVHNNQRPCGEAPSVYALQTCPVNSILTPISS